MIMGYAKKQPGVIYMITARCILQRFQLSLTDWKTVTDEWMCCVASCNLHTSVFARDSFCRWSRMRLLINSALFLFSSSQFRHVFLLLGVWQLREMQWRSACRSDAEEFHEAREYAPRESFRRKFFMVYRYFPYNESIPISPTPC
jgi:hypothetical protein